MDKINTVSIYSEEEVLENRDGSNDYYDVDELRYEIHKLASKSVNFSKSDIFKLLGKILGNGNLSIDGT